MEQAVSAPEAIQLLPVSAFMSSQSSYLDHLGSTAAPQDAVVPNEAQVYSGSLFVSDGIVGQG